jgi:hypothetical protein
MTRAGAGSAAVVQSRPPMFIVEAWEAQWMSTTSSPYADITTPSSTPTVLNCCLICPRLSRSLQSERPEASFWPYAE